MGGGSDSVGLVHSSERNSVDAEWTGNEEESGLELLEEDDSLSLESSGEDDKDMSWLETGLKLSLLVGLASS